MDVATLRAAMPGLSAEKAARYLPLMQSAMTERAITTRLRSAMWLAQVGHESASLTYFEEIASGQAYEGRDDLGNTQPGDGRRFKGRGPIQLTGRYNYTAAAAALNLPLVTNPAMAADPRYAFRVSAWWWDANDLNSYADRGDVVGATRVINGGTTNLADRQDRYRGVMALGDAIIPSGESDDDMTEKERAQLITELLQRLDDAGTNTVAGKPTNGTKFIDAVATRVVAIQKAQGKK